MANFVRKIISGKRNRLNEDGYDLDLTYITPRIIAMSFPAANFWQKMYRNNIVTVSDYIQKQHDMDFYVYLHDSSCFLCGVVMPLTGVM